MKSYSVLPSFNFPIQRQQPGMSIEPASDEKSSNVEAFNFQCSRFCIQPLHSHFSLCLRRQKMQQRRLVSISNFSAWRKIQFSLLSSHNCSISSPPASAFFFCLLKQWSLGFGETKFVVSISEKCLPSARAKKSAKNRRKLFFCADRLWK